MAQTMTAFVFKGNREIGFMEKPVPIQPETTGAIIKTTRALLCTSDIHAVEKNIESRKEITLGHEAVGIVYKLGREVKSVKEGDRVAVNASTPCFKCENCLRGFPTHCKQILGGVKFGTTKDGVLAEYFQVNDAEANLVSIPDKILDEAAVYATDMMPTGFMGAEHANIPLGGTVAIFAQGPVGLMATLGARLLGAGMVIAVENVPRRKELSKHFGADVVIDFTEVNPVEKILEFSRGKGVDSAIESLGSQETFEQCVKVTRPGGTISVIGYFSKGKYVKIPRLEWGFGMSDKTIKTGLCPGGKETMRRMLRLIEMGRLDPSPLTAHYFDFSELDKAFEMMKMKAEGIIKPMIKFDSFPSF